MALLFCCPVCGSNLRVPRSAAVATVACPGCQEPIHVPRNTHPAEALHDTPAVPAIEAARARAGLARLRVSLWLFVACAGIALVMLSLQTTVEPIEPKTLPVWVQATLGTLAFVCWGLGLLACWVRFRGYLQVRAAAAAVGVDTWVKLPAIGTIFTGIGETSVIPWLVGHSVFEFTPELMAISFIGLLCGAIGVVLEFAFVTAMHRLLWETAGWQAANKTGNYAVTFLSSCVAAMVAVMIGGALVKILGGGAADVAANPSVEVRVVTAFVLSFLMVLITLVAYRYGRLLRSTRRALAAPQPYAGPIPSVLGGLE